jgi:hypothetical protein
VTRPGELEGGEVRASDDERDRITDQPAFTAQPVGSRSRSLSIASGRRCRLRAFANLRPSSTTFPEPRYPWSRPPVHRYEWGCPVFDRSPIGWAYVSPLERTRVAALDTIATALNRSRWELMRQTPTSLEFRRSGNERIVIDLEPNGTTATTMIIHGRAPRSVRSQFAKLTFQ